MATTTPTLKNEPHEEEYVLVTATEPCEVPEDMREVMRLNSEALKELFTNKDRGSD